MTILDKKNCAIKDSLGKKQLTIDGFQQKKTVNLKFENFREKHQEFLQKKSIQAILGFCKEQMHIGDFQKKAG